MFHICRLSLLLSGSTITPSLTSPVVSDSAATLPLAGLVALWHLSGPLEGLAAEERDQTERELGPGQWAPPLLHETWMPQHH